MTQGTILQSISRELRHTHYSKKDTKFIHTHLALTPIHIRLKVPRTAKNELDASYCNKKIR